MVMSVRSARVSRIVQTYSELITGRHRLTSLDTAREDSVQQNVVEILPTYDLIQILAGLGSGNSSLQHWRPGGVNA